MDAVNTLSLLTSLWSAAWMAPAATPTPRCGVAGQCPPIQVRQIAAGGSHTCAVLNDDSLWCWGDNSRGELGVGDDVFRSDVPLLVQALPRVKSVVLGMEHTCAIDMEDDLWCWGQAGFGCHMRVSLPQRFTRPGKVKSISASPYGICALNHESELYCAGTNLNRWLTLEDPPMANGVQEFAMGEGHLCTIDGKGVTTCKGRSGAGQLGGSTNSSALEDSVTLTHPVFASIAAADDKTCGIDVHEGLWCWGHNESGQLGYSIFQFNVLPAPVELKEIGPVQEVSVLLDHTCAVGSGKLYCWGASGEGVLAGKTSVYGASFVENVAPLPSTLDVIHLSAGASARHVCAIFNNGLARCWGNNTYGQLGYGSRVQGTYGTRPDETIDNLDFLEFWR